MIKRNQNVILLIIFTCLSGSYAIYLGEDINWDLKNYHFYNAYAFLNKKMFYDFAPAMLQSFHNPLLDFPIYFLIKYLKPIQAGFILGAVQGINCYLIYILTRKFLNNFTEKQIKIICITSCIVGYYAAANLSEIGTTFGDNIVSILVLWGLYLIVADLKNKNNKKNEITTKTLIYCGLLMGFGVGAKLTLAIFPIALSVSMAWLATNVLTYFYTLIKFLSSVFVGWLVSYGYWMYILWEKFGNPMFPYFNKIFMSPYNHIFNFTDKRFLPDSVLKTLFYPFYFVRLQNYTSEVVFRGSHFAVCYVLIFIMCLYFIYKIFLLKSVVSNQQRNSFFILTFFVFSYIFWQKLFSIHRYLVVLEFLSPIVILMILSELVPNKNRLIMCFTGIAVFLIYSVKPMNWGRLPWSDSYFGVEVPSAVNFTKSNVIMASSEPLAYIVPFFPKTTRFIRVDGNFVTLDDSTKYVDAMKKQIASGTENYLLINNISKNKISKIEAKYCISVDSSHCYSIKSRLDIGLRICRVINGNARAQMQ